MVELCLASFLKIANDDELSKRVGLAIRHSRLSITNFYSQYRKLVFQGVEYSLLFIWIRFLPERIIFHIFLGIFLVSALEKMISMGKVVSVFAFLIMLCLSVLTLSRDYVGPIEDISDCSNGSKLEVYCVLSNPEDILKTPDEKYFIVSEFGGIKPYEEPKEGNLALFNLSTKMREDLDIRLGSNVWGDPKCQKR